MERMTVESEKNLNEVVDRVFALLENKKDQEGAAVLALKGDLGAGKTTLVQHIAKKLGVRAEVTSPTFLIMREYETDEDVSPSFSSLVHIDVYRIDNADEMRVLHLEELFSKKDTLVCIEWAEKIKDLLPQNVLWLQIEIENEARIFTFL